MTPKKAIPSSFRDPSGYVFLDNGVIKRVIKPIYFEQYKSLRDSGFYKRLFNNNILIPHEELSSTSSDIIIQPEQIPFITYPYEWCFNQYKEAALLTLKLQKFSLDQGYSLKDASAFNITFHQGSSIFIDTLSFDFYKENYPWRAYKQFISHFLAPLLLAHYHGSQSLKLMREFIDGIPLRMLSSMLPFKSKLNPIIYTNVHLLAKFEGKHSENYKGEAKVKSLSKGGQLKIIESLYGFVKKLKLKEYTEWGNYYDKTNYSDTSFGLKAEVINTWVSKLNPQNIIDIGGNDGTFVRAIASKVKQALVCDIDNNAVDFNHLKVKKHKENYMLPFVLDVLNPSASIGFNNKERASFLQRIKDFNLDVTLALALIHHMTLSGNVTFHMSARFFASFSKILILEFPKKNDSWVERLLNSKAEFKNHFDFYSLENFEKAYSEFFETVEKKEIEGSERVMFLLKRIKDV
ncbi:class I SAM-dependent methyltransferase [Hyunsoonleella flava]|uniref:Class I SAM-dependent methyltransferase n=1 Tax=Hyunsoonleella flava TaxID=2527939 RepID=A0A4Q9FH72_9FLAO|nr:class I SAM-dependent methyltransferase [Hyunsoonleella flava]TBN05619.1 class I SAM-dependent methyltransferase [Hyunsoonleella flava]